MWNMLMIGLSSIILIVTITSYNTIEELIIGCAATFFPLLSTIANVLIDIKENGKENKD